MTGKSVWIEDLGPKALDVCCIDTKRDQNNLCFDSVHFSDAAFYKRLGSSCLGLSNKQEISWHTGKDAKKFKKQMTDRGRYYSKESLKEWRKEEDIVDLSRAATSHVKLSDIAYIPLDFNVDVKSDSSFETAFNSNEVDPLNIHDVATQHYLFGQTPHSQVTSNEVEGKSMQESGNHWDGYVTKQTADYNKKLRENPNDIKLWMRFVKFQDEIASHGHSIYFSEESDDKRKKLSRLVTEKKIAILERAIATNPSSLELKLEHVELCMELWDSKQLKEHWDKMIFQHPNDPMLWNAYLMFMQSRFSTFSFTKILSVYGKCIGKLASIMEGQVATHKPVPNTESYLLDIFCQLCEFIRQSGHTEKAVCCYQAMLEFNLFGSHEIDDSTPHNEQIAFLETFWDSEEPKFGEKDASGWNSWMQMKQKGGWKQVTSPEETEEFDEVEDEKIPETCTGNWQAWLYLETAREQKHFLPWKPDPKKGTTEEDCEDPERMVVFDDVSSFLFKIKSQDLQFNLLLSFLRFLGVNVPLHGSSNNYEVHKHSLYALENTNQIFWKLKYFQDIPLKSVYHKFQNQQLSVGVINNCSPLEERLSPDSPTLHTPSRTVAALKEFVRNVFAQSLPLFTNNNRTDLLLVWIRFECENFEIKDDKLRKKALKQHCKEVRKFTKCILKEEINRNNLLLWRAYAELEWKLGNAEESRRIIGTALGMSGQVTSGEKVHLEAIPNLVYSYANLELELDYNVEIFMDTTKETSINKDTGGIDRLLKVLTWLGQGSEIFSHSQIESDKTSALEILKSRRGFQNKWEGNVEAYKSVFIGSDSLTPVDLQYIVEYTCCYAWFQYITVGLKAATVVFEETLTVIKTHCVSKSMMETYVDATTTTLYNHYENIFLHYIKLVIYHILRNPTPLMMIRSILQRALSAFPHSAVFLQLFIALEMKSLIIGRVRRYFDCSLHSSVSPVTWLYSIKAELIREGILAKSRMQVATQTNSSGPSIVSTGITHRIRSLFEKAVAERVARHCVLIWRLFIQFEVSYGDMKRAKSIFYRALQYCPWAKVLYLDAVRFFPDELETILDILMEKDLHIRVPIEEVEILMKSK
ncbi:nuclear exosome regulator NRDE2-like [Anneissia japonica]|uniref:nuclear exosome regulator NRDE2-like n=1 Tax=Anneissia japonica TaxID=1529436 RepID=UPI0014255E44|nr:nuclear exosome regulator NRDE2-like [Anneissia japonica]